MRRLGSNKGVDGFNRCRRRRWIQSLYPGRRRWGGGAMLWWSEVTCHWALSHASCRSLGRHWRSRRLHPLARDCGRVGTAYRRLGRRGRGRDAWTAGKGAMDGGRVAPCMWEGGRSWCCHRWWRGGRRRRGEKVVVDWGELVRR